MDQWTTLLTHSLTRRLPAPTFSRFAALLALRAPLPAPALADLLLRPTPSQHHTLDTRVPLYIHALLDTDLLDVAAVLRALVAHSSLRDSEGGPLRWASSGVHEEAVVYGVAKLVAAGSRPRTQGEAVAVLRALTEWMGMLRLAAAAEEVMREMGAGNGVRDQETAVVRGAVAALVVAVVENERVGEVVRRGCKRGRVPDALVLFGFWRWLMAVCCLLVDMSSRESRMERFVLFEIMLTDLQKHLRPSRSLWARSSRCC
jgi:hypothetical protein